MLRRSFLLLLALLVTTATSLRAQELQSKSISVVAPGQPGGTTDLIARAFIPELQRRLGRSIVVDNRPGAGGLIGVMACVQAAPDGHTWVVANESMLALPNFVKTSFNPEKDLVPVAIVTRASHMLFSSSALPVRSVAELIAWGKANPGKLNVGVIGNSTQYLQSLRFMRMTGLQGQTIPFSGNPAIMQAMLAGSVDFALASGSAFFEQAKAGRVRPLAVASAQPHPSAPTAPTLRGAGLDFEAETWQGFFVPAATPAPLVARFGAEVVAAAKQPEVDAMLRNQGYFVDTASGDAMRSMVLQAIRTGTETAQQYGIKPQ